MMDETMSKREWAIEAGRLSLSQYIRYALFGVILPSLALCLNYYMSQGGLAVFDILYTTGAMLFLPRPACLYVTICIGITALFLWIVVFHRHGLILNGVLSGIFFFNGIFCLVFGIAAVIRWLIFPVWLPPFCAAPVFFAAGVKASQMARELFSARVVWWSTIAGAILVIGTSFIAVPQPWWLMKYLPDARNADLSGRDLRGVFLAGCSGITFENAVLNDADLRGSCIVRCGINFRNATLQRVDFRYAAVEVADFSGADLRGANLDGAHLWEADFTRADLRGASLGLVWAGRTSMCETNLCGADLSQAELHHTVNFENAVYDHTTVWPDGFDPASFGAVLLDPNMPDNR